MITNDVLEHNILRIHLFLVTNNLHSDEDI